MMQVHHILSVKGAAVATVGPDVAISDAVEQLRQRGIGALVVSTDGHRIEGILSERDIVRRLAIDGPNIMELPVRSVMTEEVMTCGGNDDTDVLMRSMTDHRVRHLPVVDDGGVLTGIVSIGDVVKARLSELENENQALFDYIQGR
jgi:CBS domain-containing protein